MATTISNPTLNVAINVAMAGGAVPAPISGMVSHGAAWSPTVGVASGNANKVYSASFTVDTGTPLVLDVTALTDPLGGAVNFARIQEILITNDSTTTGQIFTVGGGTTPVLVADALTIQPNGGAACIVNPIPGYAVGSGAKLLKILVAAGTGVAGKITIVGDSA